MRTVSPHSFRARFVCACGLALSFLSQMVLAVPPPDAPVLLSELGTTRAIALESVTMRREPFTLTQPTLLSADRRTRVMLFAMNLNLLAGENYSAVSADAEDANRRLYPLTVEYVGRVPGYEWMSSIVVRLHDEMPEAGDVLVRINLHGVASNRVRIAIGRAGGGPADDVGATSTPAPPTPPAVVPEPTPNPFTSPSTLPDTVRFLEQATFGPTPELIARVRQMSFRAFLDEQFNAPSSDYPNLTPYPGNSNEGCPMGDSRAVCYRDNYTMYPLQVHFFQNALTGQDQLRQRIAFALSQLFVVSGAEIQQPSSMAPYQRMLLRNSFGNFRQLMYDVTLNPAMGRYLNMVNNDKPDPSRGTEPNENYARELLQLFTIGLYQLNQDGTLRLDSSGQPIPTYDQDTIEGFAHVFTGWTYGLRPGATMQRRNPAYYLVPMAVFGSNHDTGPKELLNGVTLPAGQTAERDLNDALDNIFNHPNVAPFISRRLIQNLVTSNPSPAYTARVSAVFNNNGAGVRGDLRAVITAILLDPEARGDIKTDPSYGHLREPVLFVTGILRAFTASSDGIINGQNAAMGQNLFNSPSVFNYYSPLYQIPGTAIRGPEFQIQNTATGLARANFINTIVFSRINAPADSPPGSTGTQINLTSMQSLADDPARLVAALDELLMHNSMSPVMRGVVTQAVTSLPASQPLQRAQTAVYLVATSAQYQVQR